MEFREDQFKHWTPAAQERAADLLREVGQSDWKPFYCSRPLCDGKPHGEWGFPHARSDQHPPKGDWLTWLMRGGRGSGKTRTGAEWVIRRTAFSSRIAIIAPRIADARDTLVEGESGILAKSKPNNRPHWEPSKGRLTWPNGAQGFTYTGEEPDRLRGKQHNDAWLDEPAHIPLIEDVWSNLLLGLRLVSRDRPRICCTTTPLPSKWMIDLINAPDTVSVVVSTYANIENLTPTFAQTVLGKYEGTRKGRQEIYGDILMDVEGALWNWDIIEDNRVEPKAAPDSYDRIVVGIDPAGSSGKKSDETGIIVVGAKDGEFYVLADYSGQFSPRQWAKRAMAAYDTYSADVIVPEVNYGGEMVTSTLENVDEFPSIKPVHSRRGKVIRADPIVALYEQRKVHHVGNLQDLEDQLVSWVPGKDSPDRLDALVHAITALAKIVSPSVIASPSQLRLLRPPTQFPRTA
jgi:phage terminase large subunit-like protein